MKYQSYLLDADGNKLSRRARKGHQGRSRRSDVFNNNKNLHSKREKRKMRENATLV